MTPTSALLVSSYIDKLFKKFETPLFWLMVVGFIVGSIWMLVTRNDDDDPFSRE